MFDLIVIGAGPGGYVAAIKAAKLGLNTAIVEEIRVGGTCLNRGCIPAKAMIHASSLYAEAKEGERFGIFADNVTFDYKKIVDYKAETTEKLVSGVEQLLKANGVTRLSGRGTLLGKACRSEGTVVTDSATGTACEKPADAAICNDAAAGAVGSDEAAANILRVKVAGAEGEEIYEAKQVLLASGSVPIMLPIPGMDLPGVLTSDELFALEEMPESLVIIGGGVISCEFAQVYANLGCQVTILEAMPRILPNMDKEISQNLKMIMKKRGVDIHTGAAVQGVEAADGLLTCKYIEKDKPCDVSAQYVLCAVGRKPNTVGLLGEGVEIDMERGRILVDEHFRTNMEGVYAIGDLIFGMQLAHAASAQGVSVAEVIAYEVAHSKGEAEGNGCEVGDNKGEAGANSCEAGDNKGAAEGNGCEAGDNKGAAEANGCEAGDNNGCSHEGIALDVIPGCVYTSPEIATVGMTEDEAKEKGVPAEVGKFIMSANGKSLITQEERGFIKVVVNKDSREIIGAQMMCARATDMIGEFVTAIANHMTAEQLLKGMRAHPTYNEGVGEALEELCGGAIHVVPKKTGRKK